MAARIIPSAVMRDAIADSAAARGERERVPPPRRRSRDGRGGLRRWPRETSPRRTRLRERPWGMSSRFAAGARGSAPRRCGYGYEVTARIIASKDKSARATVGDVATDDERGGRVWQLVLTKPLEGCGDTASAVKSAWNTVGMLPRTKLLGGRGSGGCRGKRDYGTVEG